jgi:hypothetical protein
MTRETGNPEGDEMPDASHPTRPTQRVRHRPMRLLHLMMLVAAFALTLIIPPAIIKATMNSLSRGTSNGILMHPWSMKEQLTYEVSLALTLWTMILAMIAVVGNRSRVRRAGRSYGISAIFAASSALILLFIQGIGAALQLPLRGALIFPYPGSYYIPTVFWKLVAAPEGVAAAIVAVWSILALIGAGRRPSDWFDRFCFLFGLLWVLWYFGRDLMILLPWS